MDSKIKQLWDTEVEILDVVDSICKRNNLKYSLTYGTLLGAVRHKGFIPWDDDIDLMMPREDYEKLIEIWNNDPPEGYILQTESNTDDLPINHMKIRKDHTAFIQEESEKNKKYHKGIFIDIFAGDRKAPGKILGGIQFAGFAMHLLYNRGYESHTEGVAGAVESFLLKVPETHYRAISKLFGKMSRKWNKLQTEYVFPSTIAACRVFHSPDLFDDMIRIEFEGKTYNAVKKYDDFLKTEYGDYMQLPPEKERVLKHHPLLIDFTHNYEEL